MVRHLIHGLGYPYRLHRDDLPGKPDSVFSSRHKVVFVHGCFWHQHPGCLAAHIPRSNTDYWQPKLARNVVRDASNMGILKQQGWKVLIVWECETKNTNHLKERLIKFLDDKVQKAF